MKQSIILALLLILLLSASSFATETRVRTMGENNMILLDDFNIWVFPSRLMEYPDIAVAEFGRRPVDRNVKYENDNDFSEFTQLGIHWKLGSDNPWILGTYIHNSTAVQPMESHFRANYRDTPDYGFYPDFVDFDSSLMSNRRGDLFYARKLGDYDFGFHTALVHSSTRLDGAAFQDEESFTIYNFDFGLTPDGGLYDISLGLQFLTWTDEGTNNGKAFDESKSQGNASVTVAGRYFHQVNPDYTLIPHASAGLAKYEADYFETDVNATNTGALLQTDKYNWINFNLGLGVQYTPSTNVLAVFDIGFLFDKLSADFTPTDTARPLQELSDRTFTLPYFKVGLDADVFKWMDIRLGATQFWDNNQLDDERNNFKIHRRGSSNETFLGFGFHWNKLHVDTQADPKLFLDGLNFLSGAQNNMNWTISAIYEM